MPPRTPDAPAPADPRPPRLDEDGLAEVDAVPTEDGIDLYRVRLVGAHPDLAAGGEVASAVLDAADLSGSRLRPLALTDVALRRADLSNGVWDDVVARRVAVEGCRTVGLRLFCDVAEDVLVTDCRWSDGSLYVARTKGAVVFRRCGFAGTTLRGDLSRVVFDDCDLAGAEFGADAATNADLRTSRLEGARGLRTLSGAWITAGQAVGVADLLAIEVGFRLG